MTPQTTPPATIKETEKMSELKKCPFCGELPEYQARVEVPHHRSFWPAIVYCRPCNVIFRDGERGVKSAIDKWNTRPADPLPDREKVMKQMAEALNRIKTMHAAGVSDEYFICEEALDAYSKIK